MKNKSCAYVHNKRGSSFTATSSQSVEEEEQSSSFAVFEGNMNSPYFYYVDGDYIEYLKERETQARGFTCVPNVHYWNTDKFVFGAVLEINDKVSFFISEARSIVAGLCL